MVGRVGSGLVVESFDFLWVAGRLHVNHLSINYGGGPYQRPSLISNSTPESLPIHPRTNSRHSAKPHPAPAGRRRRSLAATSQITGVYGIRFHSFLIPVCSLSDKTHTTSRKRSDTDHSRKDVQARPMFASISMPPKIVRVVQQRFAVSRLPEIQSCLSPDAVKCLCNSMACKNGRLQC